MNQIQINTTLTHQKIVQKAKILIKKKYKMKLKKQKSQLRICEDIIDEIEFIDDCDLEIMNILSNNQDTYHLENDYLVQNEYTYRERCYCPDLSFPFSVFN